MTRPRRRALRDQAESPFNLILEDLLEVVPFARAAAIVDYEGETVDYAGELDPFELRVAAATFQLVLAEARECKVFPPVQIAMPIGHYGYLLRVLDPSYSLLVVLRKLGTFCMSQQFLLEIEARILAEAGLPILRHATLFRVDVVTQGAGKRLRPTRLRTPRPPHEAPPSGGEPWIELEVLGALVGTSPKERAYRVRLLPSGAEVTLTRDAAHVWFTDEPIQALLQVGTPGVSPFQSGLDLFRAKIR